MLNRECYPCLQQPEQPLTGLVAAVNGLQSDQNRRDVVPRSQVKFNGLDGDRAQAKFRFA